MNYKFYNIIILLLITHSFCLAQNVGIGESTPVQKLHIDGSAANLQTIRVEDLGTDQDGDFGQASGANIQTSSTTGRSVYVDGNGDMTARYVYGDNTQTVIGGGASQTINTSSYINISGLTITFTPRHSVVYVNFVVSGYVNVPVAGYVSEWFCVRIERNGINTGFTSLALVAEQDDVSGSSSAGSVSASMFPVAVTPGVPVTINLSARSGGVTSGGFTIDKTNYTSYLTIWD